MVNLPNGLNINHLIDDLRNYSWEAADILLFYSNFLSNGDNHSSIIENGSHDNPVTTADLKVNDLIIRRIKENYKDLAWGILSEENVKTDCENYNINKDWLWVLDPLDGTKDFIQGTGNYAMHLALNYRNKCYIGIVLIPEKNELWITNGQNTWCEKRDGSKAEFQISKDSIKNNLKDMVLVTSKNHRNKTLKKLISKIDFKKVNVIGSIGCKVASILRGESEIYISLSLPGKSSPKDWDFAAPEAILKASGGAITNLENEELTYNSLNFEQGGIIVATNCKLTHKRTCLKIKEIIKKYDIYPCRD